ncbi:hypothetical protein MtrunA17_Chr4g0006551 [Medicago truncatula]|uniref:Uncharacterized protein n=1 Tax=Medicago truncatula TaxID=3880 RepID=A0A396I266_MEDTR|nr:hypothetical protein MtrunA17_Chr4g0006551 [Medicago truncatula]
MLQEYAYLFVVMIILLPGPNQPRLPHKAFCLKALCGSHDRFGPGSRIIITTRNIHLLGSCRVDRMYTNRRNGQK